MIFAIDKAPRINDPMCFFLFLIWYDLTQALTGKLCGDKDYVSQPLLEELHQRRLQLIARCRKKDEK